MSNSVITLRSGNFVLRNYKNSDNGDLNTLLKDRKVQFYLPGLSGEVNRLLTLSKVNHNILLIIENLYTNRVVGFILAYIDINDVYSSIISAMNTQNREKGIQKRMLKLFIEYLHKKKSAKFVTFRISASNQQALNVMKSLHIPFLKEEDNMCIFRLSLTEELPF